MNLPISIIIITYPPKTRELKYCLKALQIQTYQQFEILVINDGDDNETKQIVQSYSKFLNIKYFSRQNDMCPSRSRNIGVKNSSFEHLVFLDSDILLNPQALKIYSNFFQNNLNKDISIWGKCGHSNVNGLAKSDKEVNDHRQVFLDENFRNYVENNFDTLLLPCKAFFFNFSGNFGIRKNLYLSVNGFNENFVKWGWEDLDFALNLYKKNIQSHFSKDIWAEHLRHEKHGDFYEINSDSINTDNFKQSIKSETQKYYCDNKNQIIKEWEKVKSLCNQKNDYVERCFNEYLLKRKILEKDFI